MSDEVQAPASLQNNGQDFEPDDPTLNPELVRLVSLAVGDQVRKLLEGVPLPPEVDVEMVVQAHTSSYLLGIYLIGQNPYAAPSNLILPNLPNATDETRRVRKSGVLK